MEFDEVVRERKSVRGFTQKKVDWKNILDAVDVAIQGPFAGNHNHIKFLIVEDDKMINELAKMCEQTWIGEAQAVVIVVSDDTTLENLYHERGRVYSRQQAGAVISTFLLKLVDLGLGACWVGAYSDKDIKLSLKIPEDMQIEAVIPIGYDREHLERKKKKNIESCIFWERWGDSRKPGPFEDTKKDYSPM